MAQTHTADQSDQHSTDDARSRIGIDQLGDQPGVDPCDIACDAMPALLVGDLEPPETDWLIDHTEACGYCANELDRYQHVDSALDRLHAVTAVKPPPFVAPGRRAARYAWTDSPIGPLLLAASERGVCQIDFAPNGPRSEAHLRQELDKRGFAARPIAGDPADDPLLGPATRQLREYFAGRRDSFDVPVDLSGLTAFGTAVLEATAAVPFGQLDTYQGIAERIAKPGATRAVGNALGRNPVPVIVPCHRIVRSDHSLGGYTGGLHIKEHLLALEGTRLV
jgi:O-6-methylguanine DNA methyltransferase